MLSLAFLLFFVSALSDAFCITLPIHSELEVGDELKGFMQDALTAILAPLFNKDDGEQSLPNSINEDKSNIAHIKGQPGHKAQAGYQEEPGQALYPEQPGEPGRGGYPGQQGQSGRSGPITLQIHGDMEVGDELKGFVKKALTAVLNPMLDNEEEQSKKTVTPTVKKSLLDSIREGKSNRVHIYGKHHKSKHNKAYIDETRKQNKQQNVST